MMVSNRNLLFQGGYFQVPCSFQGGYMFVWFPNEIAQTSNGTPKVGPQEPKLWVLPHLEDHPMTGPRIRGLMTMVLCKVPPKKSNCFPSKWPWTIMNMAYFHAGLRNRDNSRFFPLHPGAKNGIDVTSLLLPDLLPRSTQLYFQGSEDWRKTNPVAKWTMENQLYIIGRAPVIGVKYTPNN